jgi:hypothetical protein
MYLDDVWKRDITIDRREYRALELLDTPEVRSILMFYKTLGYRWGFTNARTPQLLVMHDSHTHHITLSVTDTIAQVTHTLLCEMDRIHSMF